MTTSARLLSLVAAGLVTLLGATRPAAAHEPPAAPRAPHPPPSALTTGEPGPGASSGVRSLRELGEGGRAIVVGTVTRTDPFDDGKLLVFRVALTRVLQGKASGPTLSVLDIRAGLDRPPLLTDGLRAVLWVEPSPSLSYVKQTLPGEASLYRLAGGRDGIVPITNDREVDTVVGLLAASERVRSAPDQETRQRELRALAFGLLAAGQPRLAADGLLELRRLPRQLSLTSEEIATLGSVLHEPAIPAPTRIGIIRLLGQRQWDGALAVLQSAAGDRPDVLAALLDARANLGVPPTRQELAPYLTSKDPAVQAAAVGELARLDDPGAIAELGRWATADGNPAVREAAITALGHSKQPEAAPFLQQTFDTTDRARAQASARALLELDEVTANTALTALALDGSTSDVRRYAALVLVLTRGREHAAVQALLSRTPDAGVRHVLEHGFEMRDVHGND